jgi:3-keto-5-aminohexanoate cleavage enzyme
LNDKYATWDYRDSELWLRSSAKKELPPLIITAAITGGVHGKEINPNHPETPREQAEQTLECYRLGASMVHIHARSAENPAEDDSSPERFREINGLIREKCPEIIINNTSSSKGLDTPGGKAAPVRERLKFMDANPEVCSMNLGPLMGRIKMRARPPYRPEPINMEVTTPVNFTLIETIARMCMEKGIKPEMEIWHHGQFPVARYLIDQGMVKPPFWMQLIMGNGNGADATPKNLIHEMELAPSGAVLSVSGMTPYAVEMQTLAILLGMHVRCGMEDTPYYNRGEMATGNAQIVERVVRLAGELGRKIATPMEARRMMGISEKPSRY